MASEGGARAADKRPPLSQQFDTSRSKHFNVFIEFQVAKHLHLEAGKVYIT